MPILLANILRPVIQFAVTFGAATLAEAFVLPHLNNWIASIAKNLGVSEETATDIAANEVLVFAEQLGIGALTLKSRLPLKIADRLGFSAKGMQKRKIAATPEQQKAGLAKAATAVTEATGGGAAAVAQTVAKLRGLSLAKVDALASLMLKVFGVPTAFFFMIAQYIDFANWEGPYQGTFQKILAIFGLNPDNPMPKARTVSDDVWKRISATIETLGPTSIKMPFSGQQLPYSKENLVNAVDEIAANLTATGETASFKTVMGSLLPLIQLKSSAAPSAAAATAAAPALSAAPVRTVQVVTGIVSQGVLGSATSFTPRQDDLISSLGELQEAAANNLAPFIASLPGRIRYEIKMVSSITSSDGFTQRGTTQRIVSGHFANGSPKYKTVSNRFAVMTLYITNKSGGKTQLAQITLGPTDAVNFQPSAADVNSVQSYLQATIHKTDISGVTSVVPTPAAAQAVATPSTEMSQETTAQNRRRATQNFSLDGVFVDRERHYDLLYKVVGEELWVYNAYPDIFSDAERDALASDGGKFTRIAPRLALYGVDVNAIPSVPFIADIVSKYRNAQRGVSRFEEFFTASPAASASTTAPANAACSASTLSEFYTAQGQQLPSLATRAELYGSLGLGASSYYTGTAEQNVKLLSALKAKSGCTV